MAQSHFAIIPGSTVEALDLKWLKEIYNEVTRNAAPHDPPGYKTAIRLFHEGEERYLLPRAVPMLDSDRRVIGVTVILVDVTRLRHEDELKGGLVSTVSHELRTPLTSIRMAVMLLGGGKFGTLTDKQTQLLETAQTDCERLYAIVENLLNLSRIESGQAQFQMYRMRAIDVISNAIAPLRDEFTRRQVRLHEPCKTNAITGDGASGNNAPANGTPGDGTPGDGAAGEVTHGDGATDDSDACTAEITADPIFLALALSNLLANALKFTPTGGEVWATLTADDQEVVITVEDTGPGIPEQYAARIFDRFFRIPRSSGTNGAGLGLAIAREIAHAHHGQVTYLPRPAGGSIFRFSVPWPARKPWGPKTGGWPSLARQTDRIKNTEATLEN